jgi:hypothetical protein
VKHFGKEEPIEEEKFLVQENDKKLGICLDFFFVGYICKENYKIRTLLISKLYIIVTIILKLRNLTCILKI